MTGGQDNDSESLKAPHSTLKISESDEGNPPLSLSTFKLMSFAPIPEPTLYVPLSHSALVALINQCLSPAASEQLRDIGLELHMWLMTQ
ncbi:MAG TPA: hypothetical protein V6C76_11665 [Drouetiella sp.]